MTEGSTGPQAPESGNVAETTQQPPEQPETAEAGASAYEKDADYPAGVWMARLDRVRRLLPRRLYLSLLGRLSARFGNEWARRNSDDRDNNRGIPPVDERVEWHGVWIAEAFLPSTVSKLVAGVERLGWWDPHGDKTVADIVSAGRSGRGGGWSNLPMLRRRSKHPKFGIGTLDRELPEGVEYVTGGIHLLTSSLTVLVVGFRFDSTVSDALDAAVRRRYRTYHVRLERGGSRMMSPDFQRRDAVRDLERRYVDDCRRWLAERLEGYFGSGDEESKAPATLLLTTKVDVPFERDRDARDWKDDVGLGFAFERWETGIDGLRYAFRSADVGVPVLAGRQSDIFADTDEWRHYGPEPSISGLMTKIEYNLTRLMAVRAIDAILADVQRRLGRLRDSLAELTASPTKRQLSSVQHQLATMSSDVAYITAEMIDLPNQRRWIVRDLPDIKLIDDFGRRPPTEDDKPLKRRLVDWYVDHAREVRDFEAATRGLLVASADISSALENIKLQGFVRWVSVLALIVALVALVVTGVGVAHQFGWLATPAP